MVCLYVRDNNIVIIHYLCDAATNYNVLLQNTVLITNHIFSHYFLISGVKTLIYYLK